MIGSVFSGSSKEIWKNRERGMNLVVTNTIFDEFPELVLGVVILHSIDNSQNWAEITDLLRQAEAALPGKFGSAPVIEHPYIAA